MEKVEQVFIEQYKTLVTRTFSHREDEDLIYTFGEVQGEEVQILDSEGNSKLYPLLKVLALVRNKFWIIQN